MKNKNIRTYVLLLSSERNEIEKSNDSNKLKIYLEFILNKKYDWIKKINNLDLLKKIILLDLADKINSLISDDLRLISNSNLKNTLKGVRYSTITLLLKERLITKEEADRFEAVIMLSKPKHIKGKHYNKKRKQKKAASSGYLQLFAIIIFVTQLLFFLHQHSRLLLF